MTLRGSCRAIHKIDRAVELLTVAHGGMNLGGIDLETLGEAKDLEASTRAHATRKAELRAVHLLGGSPGRIEV